MFVEDPMTSAEKIQWAIIFAIFVALFALGRYFGRKKDSVLDR